MQPKRTLLMMKIKMGMVFGLFLAISATGWGQGSWSYYGQDAGGGRYTSLHQIDGGNVGRLAVAWTYRTGELKTYEGTSTLEKAAFETTPVLVGRTLYFSTPSD